jgi:divalent metal cation (Fe/Co/Zn/Cd) transporter
MLLVALISPAARRAALRAPPYSCSSIVVGRCETARPHQLLIVDPQRQTLIRQAFRLEWFSVGWMAIEAAVAVASGIAARSITLVAFGLDSVIELASAGVLIWRLSTELKFDREVSEEAERIARRIAGGLLFALATYVVVAAGWSLWRGGGEAFSWPGLAVALLSIPIMLVLARRKLALADQLGSRALRADAAEAVVCLWLSVVVIDLVAQLAFGAWWIDAVTSLAIVWFLVKEGREALEVEEDD